MKPLISEPAKGQIRLYLETCQTGRSLFTREDQADSLKQRMQLILDSLFVNIIDRKELSIFSGEFCWNLNIDILVLDELSLEQLDYISLCVRAALLNLELPQTIATLNNNTGKIEVGLVEEVYADKENTDQPIVLKSALHAPFIISIGVIRNTSQDITNADSNLAILLDATQTELKCIDQILHFAVDSKLKIHGMTQSKGDGASSGEGDSSGNASEMSCLPAVPSSLFLAANLKKVLSERISELQEIFA